MTKRTTTINVYEWNIPNFTFDKPKITEYEKYKEDRGLTTDKEVVDHINSFYNTYFIGTQAEYDALKTPIIIYYEAEPANNSGIAKTGVNPINNLVDGKVVISFEKNIKQGWPEAVEKTKQQYEDYLVAEQIKIDAANTERDKLNLAQDNIYLSAAKVAEDQMKGSIADQRINLLLIANQSTDSVLRTTLANWGKDDSFVPAEIMKLGLNVSYWNKVNDLGTYSDALVQTEEARRKTFYENVIDNDMSVIDAFKDALNEHLPANIIKRNGKDIDTVQSGKEDHEEYIIKLLGQADYDAYLAQTAGLDLSTHLDPFVETK